MKFVTSRKSGRSEEKIKSKSEKKSKVETAPILQVYIVRKCRKGS
jgi:hypothetical protein